MKFPSEKQLKSIRAKLERVDPSRLLPKNASKSDRLKYELCEMFVVYLREHKMTQVSLARKLKIDPARVNEIVRYRIDLFTVDKLINIAEALKMDFEVKVA